MKGSGRDGRYAGDDGSAGLLYGRLVLFKLGMCKRTWVSKVVAWRRLCAIL